MKKRTALWELRDFLLLWSTQAISELGTAMTNYALVLWTYAQNETATSLTTLTLSSFLPTILLRFAAGAMADRWNKKHIMLLSDLLAACATGTVLVLHAVNGLRAWQLYLINFLLSCMNAFQVPASFAATSLLVPPRYYAKAGGMQSFSGAAIAILAPALGGLLVTHGGLKLVLVCDLASFVLAITVLQFLIAIPVTDQQAERRQEVFWVSCMQGVRYLHAHKALMRIILLFAVINFLAKLGNDGMMAPFVLGRTGNNQSALGFVQSATAFGALAGSIAATMMRTPKSRTRFVFLSVALIFASNIVQSMTTRVAIWAATSFAAYGVAVVMNTVLTAMLREQIPLELHGRVFSARDTLQNISIPLALLLGGGLADDVLEPFMAGDSPLQNIASCFFGSGSGSGIAVMFFCAGVLGCVCCLISLLDPIYRELDQPRHHQS